MYRVLYFINRKPGLTHEEFRHHYENIHIPLVIKLSGSTFPLLYKRRYVLPDTSRYQAHDVSGTNSHKVEIDFDVVTEVVFKTKEDFDKWNHKIVEDGSLLADGATHQVQATLRKVVFEEEVTVDGITEKGDHRGKWKM